MLSLSTLSRLNIFGISRFGICRAYKFPISVCVVSEEQFSQVYLLFSSCLPACQCDKKGHNFQSSNVPIEV